MNAVSVDDCSAGFSTDEETGGTELLDVPMEEVEGKETVDTDMGVLLMVADVWTADELSV